MRKRSTYRRSSRFGAGPLLIGGAVALIAAVGVGATIAWQSTRAEQSCTVEDKDRTTDSEGASVHRVYTDCGVFNVQDDLLNGQFNSADVYGSLKVGETYTIETVGWRLPLFSSFPNIVGVS